MSKFIAVDGDRRTLPGRRAADSLILEVSSKLGDMHVDLAKLREDMKEASRQRVALARDVQCISESSKAFLQQFSTVYEPLLKDSIESKKKRAETTREVLKDVFSWALIGAIVLAGKVGYDYVKHDMTEVRK